MSFACPRDIYFGRSREKHYLCSQKSSKRMETSKTIHSFLLSKHEGHTLLTAQEYPWSVLQVIPTTPADFESTVAVLEQRGMVAHHDIDRTFCIIHLASGDHDGQHPERYITINQNNYMQLIEALKDTMAQAAVWYETNIIESTRWRN